MPDVYDAEAAASRAAPTSKLSAAELLGDCSQYYSRVLQEFFLLFDRLYLM